MAIIPERYAPPPTARETEIRLVGAARAYGRDQEVFGQGERCDFVFKVASGAVRTFRILADGRRQISEFHLAGDIFGLELDEHRHTAAEAIGEAVLIVARRVSVIAEDAGNQTALWRRAAADLAACREHALTLGRRSAAERLAGFLLEFAERTGADAILDLPMSRQDIADYLGLTIETVSRTFTALQAEGLIDARGCRRVRLIDRRSLQDLCE
jgi:CRP/FNR family nitrogen fixation transcriptional regulator